MGLHVFFLWRTTSPQLIHFVNKDSEIYEVSSQIMLVMPSVSYIRTSTLLWVLGLHIWLQKISKTIFNTNNMLLDKLIFKQESFICKGWFWWAKFCPILEIINSWNCEGYNAFVKASDNWQVERTWSVFIKIESKRSRTTWQSMSMCFVLSWKNMIRDNVQSCSIITIKQSRSRSRKLQISKNGRYLNQFISFKSQVEIRETVGFFLDLQEIREFPMNIQKPVTDLRVSEQTVWSKYVKSQNESTE